MRLSIYFFFAWLYEGDATRFVKALCKEAKPNRRSRNTGLGGHQKISVTRSESCDGLRIQNALDMLKQARIDHPKWQCKDIKAAYSSACFLVYHHDKSLLDHALPPKVIPHPPGKNWAQEDQRIVDEILALRTVKHMSLSQIDRCVKGRGVRKSLAKLPKTRALLKRLGKLPNQ